MTVHREDRDLTGWAVTMHIDGRPVRDPSTAELIALLRGWHWVDEHDPDSGEWLVDIDPATYETVMDSGWWHAEVKTDTMTIGVEIQRDAR